MISIAFRTSLNGNITLEGLSLLPQYHTHLRIAAQSRSLHLSSSSTLATSISASPSVSF
jgi:predicted DNA-binding protein with PD1-like motif